MIDASGVAVARHASELRTRRQVSSAAAAHRATQIAASVMSTLTIRRQVLAVPMPDDHSNDLDHYVAPGAEALKP